jgi:hypothetical protein
VAAEIMKPTNEAALLELMRADRLVRNQRRAREDIESYDPERTARKRAERQRRRERECQQST